MPTPSDVTILESTPRALNGERPAWNPRDGRLYWVDIRGAMLHALDVRTGKDQGWEMPAWIGCFSLTAKGAIVALRTGLHDFDFATGALEPLAPAPFDPRRFFFNDGRCDPTGRFLAGTMYLPLQPGDQSGEEPATPLWCYEGRERWRAVTPPVHTSNGLSWSPDGRTMYHPDTKPKVIWAYDYDVATGAAENRRTFATVDVSDGGHGPDGASVDAEGFYLCAVFGEGCLLRFDPDGRLERRIAMPVRYPTMPVFGGDDLSTVYVTSADWPVPAAKRGGTPDGKLCALPAPARGQPSVFFKAPS